MANLTATGEGPREATGEEVDGPGAGLAFVVAAGVGHTDAIKVQGTQLIATGVVSRDTAAAREVVVSSRNGFPWQASIGAAVENAEFVK